MFLGLEFRHLRGHTLVNYSGSLTGGDFRVLVQAAPFVLQGLLPAPYIELWTSLSAVVTLVWQPHIPDIERYIAQLDAAIKHFLDCTCRITLQWFNKPKFIRFGPAMLFATEGFESFNAIIRSASVHSNRHAPSLDIAARMARGNRVRHLLSQGFFPSNRDYQPTLPENHRTKLTPKPPSESPWMDISFEELKRCKWIQAGQSPLQLMGLNSFGSRLLGWEQISLQEVPPGLCNEIGPITEWTATKSAAAGVPSNASRAFTPETVTLGNGDICSVGDWVVWAESSGQTEISRIGCVTEIIQLAGSPAQQAGQADFLLLSRTIIREVHDIYKMRRLQPIPNEYRHVSIKDIKCTVNIQHNCADNKCRSTRSRVILNEREKTSERSLAVEHLSKSDLIINTAQMRDAAALNTFRWCPATLDSANIIQISANQAYLSRQKQKKSTAPDEVEGEAEDSTSRDAEPARKRSRLDLPATSSTGPSTSRAGSVQQKLHQPRTPPWNTK
ncbi:hypothetical protein B0H14DRAFT_2621851 [Mycena olivaceomarginata]|nr:hypothetical protein B0H14DRAFT_2621851 [Mycena olivaceomarginata]